MEFSIHKQSNNFIDLCSTLQSPSFKRRSLLSNILHALLLLPAVVRVVDKVEPREDEQTGDGVGRVSGGNLLQLGGQSGGSVGLETGGLSSGHLGLVLLVLSGVLSDTEESQTASGVSGSETNGEAEHGSDSQELGRGSSKLALDGVQPLGKADTGGEGGCSETKDTIVRGSHVAHHSLEVGVSIDELG